MSRMLGVPPADGEGDADLFPEWDEYLAMEKEGKSGTLVDVSEEVPVEDGVDGEGQENGAEEVEAEA